MRIDPDMPLAQAALIGCCVTTGVGAALWTAKVQPGTSVVVIGCGGVGLNIQGAALAGAERIIAVDTMPSKLSTKCRRHASGACLRSRSRHGGA